MCESMNENRCEYVNISCNTYRIARLTVIYRGYFFELLIFSKVCTVKYYYGNIEK